MRIYLDDRARTVVDKISKELESLKVEIMEVEKTYRGDGSDGFFDIEIKTSDWIHVNDSLPEVTSHNSYSKSRDLIGLIGDEALIVRYGKSNDPDDIWDEWYCPAYEDSVIGITHWKYLGDLPKDK